MLGTLFSFPCLLTMVGLPAGCTCGQTGRKIVDKERELGPRAIGQSEDYHVWSTATCSLPELSLCLIMPAPCQ